LTIGGCITFLSVLASYSRGAYLALAALVILGWFRARNKLIYPVLIAIIAIPALKFMPAEFYDRLNTLNSTSQDGSFQGRVTAWKVAFYYARDHFPIGAGFDGAGQIFHTYFPRETARAAHSIFFQVLGDQGFLGLTLYLVILLLALVNVQKIRKAARNRPDLAWIRDLATMIQLGLLVYCVGGAALSMAYDDVAIIWFFLLPVLLNMVSQAQPQRSERFGVGRPSFASPRPSTVDALNQPSNAGIASSAFIPRDASSP
jgi:probable O-glycosylation ligase (exosortase A-associated)